MARAVFVGVVIAVAVVAGAPSAAAGRCGWSGYSYAGMRSGAVANGIAATVEALRLPRVASGHVAAWVGVGGYGAGPDGEDVWLQAGLVARPGRTNRLYVEWKTPRQGRRYLDVGAAGAARAAHRLVVAELPGRPGVWRVSVAGRPVLAGLRLPGSHDRFRPVATAESWDGGRPACNRFAFRFGQLALAGLDGRWRPIGPSYRLQDPGYRVIRRQGAFVARSGG